MLSTVYILFNMEFNMSYKVEKLFRVDKESFEQYDFDQKDKYFFFSGFDVISANSFLGLIKKLLNTKTTRWITISLFCI